ncbi:hypothetical protein [Streptomyces palmae]|uniref:Uncharacterized protein n=1 Tax=Streptomyces palmae TaxID=1701085 RepID=A0A4Z0H7D2_9ACTN|nr:hypothetical protein [Streptomyces palmae]TGB10016.1 hypothetical protein E4099_13115 [Streptomyces palmae]
MPDQPNQRAKLAAGRRPGVGTGMMRPPAADCEASIGAGTAVWCAPEADGVLGSETDRAARPRGGVSPDMCGRLAGTCNAAAVTVSGDSAFSADQGSSASAALD